MSPVARLVPWRHPSDLHNLKSCFYPTSPPASTAPDADPRHRAIQKVRAWGTRMRIPHSIESTALLAQAVLTDTPTASQLSSRLCYASALCRFVNGLLDPAQTSTFALPMHTLAKTLGLPTSFVEIRHAATHEALPSLPLLRAATARALDWLWENYWSSLSDSSSDPEPVEGEEGGAKARALLKSFRSLRRAEPARPLRSGDGCEETKLAMSLIKECICVAGDGLVEALLEEKALIPAGKHKSSSMKGAILLWTPLLDALDVAVPEFGNALLLAMLESLKHVAAATTQQREFAEAVMAWLVHLTTSNTNAKGGFGTNPDAPIDLDGLAKQCVLCPSEWTMRLLRHLLREHAALRGRYAGLVEMAEAQVVLSRDLGVEIEERMKRKGTSKADGGEGNTQLPGKKRSIYDIEEEVKMFEARYEAVKKMRLSRNLGSTIPTSISESDKEPIDDREGEVVIGTWKKWSGKWAPRPIGVV